MKKLIILLVLLFPVVSCHGEQGRLDKEARNCELMHIAPMLNSERPDLACRFEVDSSGSVTEYEICMCYEKDRIYKYIKFPGGSPTKTKVIQGGK